MQFHTFKQFQVVKQCCGTDGVEPQYIMDEILPHFFKHFWNHRMALDRRNYRQLVDTTVEIANKVSFVTNFKTYLEKITKKVTIN